MKLSISIATLSQAADEIGTYSNRFSQLTNDLQEEAAAIRGTKAGRDHNQALKKIVSQASSGYLALSHLHHAGVSIVSEYRTCEIQASSVSASPNALAVGGNAIGFRGDSLSENEAGTWSPFDSNSGEINWSFLRNSIGKFGTAGAMVSAVWGLSEGGASAWKNSAKLFETGAKTLSKMAEGKEIVDLFGTAAAEATSLSTELKKYVYDPSKYTTTLGKNAAQWSVAAKWTGLAFSTLLNFSDNYDEFNYDISNIRLYEETVAETAVDFSAGIATTLVAGAIATAAGAATVLPGIVVGIGVTSVANMVVEGIEAVTGIDVKEAVSDFVVDTAENLVKQTTNAVIQTKATVEHVANQAKKLVGNVVSGAADCISAGWKKLKKWF